jgi:fucose permease
MLLLKIFDSRRVLIGASVGALGCLSAALFGPASISVIAFPAIGLFASVMWPIVAIIGGAIVPVIIGRIGDYAGLRSGVAFLYVTFGFVLSIGFWARPLITNATISIKKAQAEAAV